MNLTEAAKTALINASSSRQGTKITADAVVVTELFDAGLVGLSDGLTARGTIARDRLVSAALEAAFG